MIELTKNKAFLLILLTFGATAAMAQAKKSAKPAAKAAAPAAQPVKADEWVFTYGPDTVYREEFQRLLSKNKKDEVPDEKTVREYLELYENFKMKVAEAKKRSLDTASSFKTELAGYRKQLATPYLTDKKVTEGLISEAYERMKWEVHASHILINCEENANPKDTLAAYNKILDIRKRFLKGERFDSLAAKYSEDPSAAKNFGELGWFTSFHMIYPFETMAFTTPKGQVSMPFRTRFGYHIVKVNDKREARGEVKIAHIMIRTGPSATAEVLAEAKAKADSAYDQLQKGASFESMVDKYSQDDASKANKGEMNWFGSFSNYPDEFKTHAFAMEKGSFTKPFTTPYGVHIIKLIDKRGLPERKEMEETIKSKIGRDSRAESSKTVVAQRIKRENGYREYPANIREVTDMLDSTFLQGLWSAKDRKAGTKPVFSLNNRNFTQQEFADYLATNQEAQPSTKGSIPMVVNSMFKKFTDEKALEYEESMLETKYPDFRHLMTEYYEGILLFDITDRLVWTKAVTDTAGLEKFHEANKGKYMWKERVKVLTYSFLDEKSKKEGMKMANAGKTPDEIKAKLNKKIAGTVIVTEQKAEKGENPVMDKMWDKKGVQDIPSEGMNHKFYYVVGVVPPEPKSLKEARGLVTSDYQNHLEKEWVREIRGKYPVTVNEETVKKLFK